MNYIKIIKQTPRLFLANYFFDLRTEVDLVFQLKLDEKEKYQEIIKRIDSFEEDVNRRFKYGQQLDAFNNEIQSTEQLENDVTQLQQHINNKIDDLKYKMEKFVFSNKSIMFFKDSEIEEENKSFLLIINDEYLRKSTFENSEYFNRENLIAYFLKQKLARTNIKNIICLDIEIMNQFTIDYSQNKVKYIDQNTFNGLTNLEKIDFAQNQIQELSPSLFNGLSNLLSLIFSDNKIKEIHQNTFVDLEKVKHIQLDKNQIEEINFSSFIGLKSLKRIFLGKNQIKNLDLSTFNNLTKLEEIYCNENKFQEIHPLTFSGLKNLKKINFSRNQIQKIHQNTFNYLGIS
jgi:Leucine-rich repeat (LRR) protein